MTAVKRLALAEVPKLPAPARAKRPTLAEIREWPAVIDVTDLALALGISRSSAYELVRTNRCPVQTITVGHRVKALTADLIRVLESGTAGH